MDSDKITVNIGGHYLNDLLSKRTSHCPEGAPIQLQDDTKKPSRIEALHSASRTKAETGRHCAC